MPQRGLEPLVVGRLFHPGDRRCGRGRRTAARGRQGMNGATNVAMNVTWPDRLFDAFKRADIRQVGYVPDAGHARLIERCQADPDIRAVSLTTEEEGIALAAGAWLGGERAALLMQSSGVGNCINMLSLARSCRFPLPIFITM